MLRVLLKLLAELTGQTRFDDDRDPFLRDGGPSLLD